MEDAADGCLRGVIAEVRRDIEADEWTAAYVRLLKLNYCEAADGCPRSSHCGRVRDVFRRNIERVQGSDRACG